MAFLQTFINVVTIVVLAVPGYFLRKCKLLPDKAASIFAVLLLYISQPFLMMSSLFNKKFEASMLINFAWVILFAVGLQFLIYFAAKLIFAKTKEEASRRACVACSYLGNVGFMGIPVMQMLYPGNDEMVLYTVIYNIAFNAMTWTLGVFAITGEKKMINPLKIVLNPPTIAVIIALPFFFLNVHIPEQVMSPISYLGDMTLPLSMIILGVRLADMRFIGVRAKSPVAVRAETSAVAAPSEALSFERAELSDISAAETQDIVPDPLSAGEKVGEIMSEEGADLLAPAEQIVPTGEVSSEKEGSESEVLSRKDSTGNSDEAAVESKKGILDNWKVYLVAFVKLILSPLLGLAVMLLIRLVVPIDRFVIIALFIIGAMPSASSALNFAEMYGGDKETAAAATLMNTVLCILSIPVLMLLCELI